MLVTVEQFVALHERLAGTFPLIQRIWRDVVSLAAERGEDAHQAIGTISMGDRS
jgi:hypothetical protein